MTLVEVHLHVPPEVAPDVARTTADIYERSCRRGTIGVETLRAWALGGDKAAAEALARVEGQ